MSTTNKNRFLPAFESLEERRLMTAGVTAVLDHRTLTVTGTNGDDKIIFREVSGVNNYLVAGPAVQPLRQVEHFCQVSIDGVKIQEGAASMSSVRRSSFDRIVIDTKDGNDVVDLRALQTSIEYSSVHGHPQVFDGHGTGLILPTLVDAPDVHVRGGKGHRTLYAAQSGHDYAEGALGTNLLHGHWQLVGRPKGADTFANDPLGLPTPPPWYRPVPEPRPVPTPKPVMNPVKPAAEPTTKILATAHSTTTAHELAANDLVFASLAQKSL